MATAYAPRMAFAGIVAETTNLGVAFNTMSYRM